MEAIIAVLGVPDLQPETGVVRRSEHDRLLAKTHALRSGLATWEGRLRGRRGAPRAAHRRPLPVAQDEKEAFKQERGRGARIQLTDEGREDVAVDPAEIAHLIRVQAAPLRPEPHTAQHADERVKRRHEPLDHIRGAWAIERLLRADVGAAEHVVVVDVEVARHSVDGQAREEQVDIHAIKIEGDDRDDGRFDRREILDRVVVLEDHFERVKEVFASHVARCDADRVDVHPLLVDA